MAQPTLTYEQAKEMQEALIEAYSTPDFRHKLSKAVEGVEGSVVKQSRIRHALCLPVEGPIIAKYGFDPTPEGVSKSSTAIMALMKEHPDVIERNDRIARLVNPALEADMDARVCAD